MNPQQIPELTKGTCERFKNAQPEDPDVFSTEYTVQFLSLKKVGTTDGRTGFDRYRIIISDGTHYMQAMLATQLNAMVQENQITKGSIVVLEKLTCNYVQEKRLVIVLGLRVLVHSAEKIGDPQSIDGVDAITPAPGIANNAAASGSGGNQAPTAPTAPQTTRSGAKPARGTIFPIEGLSPYQNNWTIKARVTQKSEIKTWSNARGEGKLFNVTFMDDSGEIRATGFNAVVDDLYSRVEEGKVYFVSKARVNLAKKKFSNVNNDYELGLEKGTEIEECHETTNVPTIKYNFVPLNKLEELVKDAICDVIGIVKESGELTQINSAKLNKSIQKRDLTMVDNSGFGVRLTLWGKQAEQYNDSDSPVIAVKGVKVGDFGGRSLSMISSSTMQINPDIKECFVLRAWYDTDGSGQNFKVHSTSTSFSLSTFNRSELRAFEEIKQAGYGTPGNPEYFSARGTVMHIKSDTVSYPACANDGCNKKVEEVGGLWRCEKCNQSFEAPKHRYIMSMAVSDYSGQAWLQGFNDVGELIFGMSANDLLEIKGRDEKQYNAVVEKACGHGFNFSCRAKQDTWKDTPRIKYGISRITALDYKEEANALRDLLYSQWAR